MSEKQFAKIVGTVKQIGSDESRVLRFVGSTETPDRSEDVISVTGWDVASYLKNPVLLWAHDYTRPPIGKAQSVYIDERSKSLVFDIKFPTIEEISKSDNPSEHALFVDTIYKMYKAGILNAVSVGFRGIEYGPRNDQADKPVYSRGIKFDKQELLELSAVPVPANPEALVTARSISGISTKGLDLVFETVEIQKDVAENKAIDMENNMEIEALTKRIEELEAKLAEIKNPEGKANRRLSQASMARVEACQDHMMKAMDELKGLVSDGVVEDDTPASDGVERSASSNFSAKSTVDEINEHLRKNAEPSKE